jgi:hypothetical protein
MEVAKDQGPWWVILLLLVVVTCAVALCACVFGSTLMLRGSRGEGQGPGALVRPAAAAGCAAGMTGSKLALALLLRIDVRVGLADSHLLLRVLVLPLLPVLAWPAESLYCVPLPVFCIQLLLLWPAAAVAGIVSCPTSIPVLVSNHQLHCKMNCRLQVWH